MIKSSYQQYEPSYQFVQTWIAIFKTTDSPRLWHSPLRDLNVDSLLTSKPTTFGPPLVILINKLQIELSYYMRYEPVYLTHCQLIFQLSQQWVPRHAPSC